MIINGHELEETHQLIQEKLESIHNSVETGDFNNPTTESRVIADTNIIWKFFEEQNEIENIPSVQTLGMKVQHHASEGIQLTDEDNLNKKNKTDSETSEEAKQSESESESSPRISEAPSVKRPRFVTLVTATGLPDFPKNHMNAPQ